MKADSLITKYAVCGGIALIIHALLLFGWRSTLFQKAKFTVRSQPEAEQINLVSAPPSDDPAQSATPAATPPPMPQPSPTPVLEPVQRPKQTPKPKPPKPVKPAIAKAEKSKPLPKKPAHPRHHSFLKKSAKSKTKKTSAAHGAAPAEHARVTGHASLINNPPPAYPEISRRNGEQGVVTLTVKVSTEGRVDSVQISRSSGFPRLDAAAMQAVRHWRFKPARAAGIPVSDTIIVPIRFDLKN